MSKITELPTDKHRMRTHIRDALRVNISLSLLLHSGLFIPVYFLFVVKNPLNLSFKKGEGRREARREVGMEGETERR